MQDMTRTDATQSSDEARAAISRVLASESRSLDVTVEQATELMATIREQDLADDDAFAAYDLLHSRVMFGRAF